MAANLSVKPQVMPLGFDVLPQPNDTPVTTVHADLARLAALHEEAAETARLANLLGRAPTIAAALAAGAGLTAVLSLGTAEASPTIAWLVLVVIGVGAVVRSYAQAIRAPFERAPLRAFAEDLRAIMLYAGFAWGAGAFLALPAATTPAALIAFSAGMSLLVAMTLREKIALLNFIAPAGVLCAASALLRPLPGGGLAALSLLALCALVAVGATKLESAGREARAIPLPAP